MRDTGSRMDPEKDDVRKFEAAARYGNNRKLANIGLPGDAERPVARFVKGAEYPLAGFSGRIGAVQS